MALHDDTHGFGFPFRVDPSTGGIARQSGPEKLRENVAHLLMTTVGERAMNREYGGGLRDLVHDPNNDALRAIVEHRVGKAIGRLEPRVLVTGVRVSQDGGRLDVAVSYVVRNTGRLDAVRVPVSFGGV